ncbi:MAG: transposase [Flavobacteriales bacterium]|nr:transposase [Flavobacteriales bacterium]
MGRRYPEIAAKWEKDWCELSPFFDHPDAIRRGIYTTNPVEACTAFFARPPRPRVRSSAKVPLEKQLYLTLKHNEKSWKRKVRSWPHHPSVVEQHVPRKDWPMCWSEDPARRHSPLAWGQENVTVPQCRLTHISEYSPVLSVCSTPQKLDR